MEASFTSHRATIPVIDLVRAQVAANPVSMPVQGNTFTRLDHIRAVPASTGHGYSIHRLRALDAMIARMSAEAPEREAPTNLERQELAIERAAEKLAHDLESASPSLDMSAFLLDISA